MPEAGQFVSLSTWIKLYVICLIYIKQTSQNEKSNISSFKHQQNFKLFWYLFKILSYHLNLHTWYFTFFLLIYSNTHVSYNQECFTSCRALPQKMWPQFVSIPYCVFPRHTGQSISPGLVRTLVVAWTCSRVDRTFSSLSGCIFWAPSL